MKRILLISLLVVFVPAVVLHAQRFDLPTLLEQSRSNYPLLKARQLDVESAEQDVLTSKSDYIPRLAVQHQYSYGTSNSVAGSFYPNPAVISPSGGIRAENTYVATWGSFTSTLMEWNIFNFGKVSANVSAAKAGLASTQAAYENELFQHQVRVTDAYLLTLITERLTRIQESNLQRARRFKEVVAASVRSGLRAGVDSSLANAEYTKAEMLLLETKRNAQSQLLQLMELSGTIGTTLEQPDSMRFFSALPLLPDTSSASVNPILELYDARMRQSVARSTAIRRSYLPSISLVGAAWARGSGVSPADDTFQTSFHDGTEYKVYNYLFGASTRWNLTDIIPISHRYRSERYHSVRDREQYNEQVLKLQRQRKESQIHYSLMTEQASRAPIQLAAAQRAYRQASARYSSGLTDLPTMLQSMVTLSRAEADMAIAYSNTWRGLLAIAAAKGDLNIFLNAIQ
ncbi:TolC family protein [Chryseolinea sp. T2]|uniref:TolC family protein n=1 Tax=Chryseolinea sp. T2 TaxID=3129255 RepID=UPI0030778D05